MTLSARTVTKLRLRPPSDEAMAGRRIVVTRRPRGGRTLRQLLKPKTCLIRADSGFRRCLVVSLAAVFAGRTIGSIAAPQPPQQGQPSFLAAQATAGRAAYDASCSGCHLPDLKGSFE